MLFAMFGGSISIADTDTLTFGKNLTVEVGIPTASDIALLYDDNHTMTHAPLTKTDQEHKAIQNMDQALDTNTIVHELSDEHTGDDLGEDVGSAFSIDDIINDQVNRVTPDLITPHSETKITDISFKRALNNGSVISFNWKQENAEIHFSDAKNTLLITFFNAQIDQDWLHSIDASVFNTIVNTIDITQVGNNIEVVLHMGQAFSYEYQKLADRLVVTINKAYSEIEGFNVNKSISLKFQNIEVRSLLQILAQFAGLNLVVSDGVTGTISLNLKDVPWEEALQIVLMSKGLGKRQMGNILYIAPVAEIAAQDEQEALAKKANQQVAPLKIAYIPLNYAKALETTKMLTSGSVDLFSARGSIVADERTNTLIVSDTADSIEKIRAMISELDQPVDQVLIEARIVEVTKDSVFELGIGYNAVDSNNENNVISILPNYIKGADAKAGSSNAAISFTGLFGGIDLSLELSALETEGNAKVVSSPHLVVAENKEAYIKQGKEIPYNESTASGAASIAFKEAVLELQVVPQIAPNGKVILEVTVKKDGVTQDTAGLTEEPILDKREIQTKLMVQNGQTVVLGGIYERSATKKQSQVPLLGDIPLLGWLFRSVSNEYENKELLIFITPKIIEQDEY